MQWATNPAPSVGAVGANIYQCAISGSTESLNANYCDETYTTAVNVNATPDSQILQSLNYIYFNILQTNLNQPIFYGQGTTRYPILPEPTESDLGVVFLFSAEYIGPMQSYTTSGLQCAEASGNCSCIASLYTPTASCGDGNNFGTWGSNLSYFRMFTNEFLKSQEINNKCPAPGGCATGIYMYDFIPQQWYGQ